MLEGPQLLQALSLFKRSGMEPGERTQRGPTIDIQSKMSPSLRLGVSRTYVGY